MSCGKMYVVDPAIDAFLKIFIQKLILPFMFKGKPFISYSLSIITGRKTCIFAFFATKF
jgi:hypothetical protein